MRYVVLSQAPMASHASDRGVSWWLGDEAELRGMPRVLTEPVTAWLEDGYTRLPAVIETVHGRDEIRHTWRTSVSGGVVVFTREAA